MINNIIEYILIFMLVFALVGIAAMEIYEIIRRNKDE